MNKTKDYYLYVFDEVREKVIEKWPNIDPFKADEIADLMIENSAFVCNLIQNAFTEFTLESWK